MQAQHFVTSGNADVDVIALAQAGGRTVIGVMTVRGGRNLGQRSHFPTQVAGHDEGEVLEAFLGQYYAERGVPPLVIVSHPVNESERLEVALGEAAGRKVRLQPRPRGERRQWLELARRNAASALELKLAGQGGVDRQLADLAELLGLEDTPAWIECFDISHTQGNQAVGACVAFDREGPAKSRYRRYNLRDITPGDDYAAMHQVLTRRYRHAAENDGDVPDLLIIDGGKGQVTRALEALDEVGLEGVPLVGVSKGADRRAGFETWVLPGRGAALEPGPESPASHLVQRIRDEAHRFAITGHRGRRQKATVGSVLEDIPGIGAKRRRALLTHFGGLKGVRKAAVEDLESVPGINRHLAEKIFRALH
jgi:excinuclease ABC subunit C